MLEKMTPNWLARPILLNLDLLWFIPYVSSEQEQNQNKSFANRKYQDEEMFRPAGILPIPLREGFQKKRRKVWPL